MTNAHLMWLLLPREETVATCKTCRHGIARDDPFGIAEGACRSCRHENRTVPATRDEVASSAGRVGAWLRRTVRFA